MAFRIIKCRSAPPDTPVTPHGQPCISHQPAILQLGSSSVSCAPCRCRRNSRAAKRGDSLPAFAWPPISACVPGTCTPPTVSPGQYLLLPRPTSRRTTRPSGHLPCRRPRQREVLQPASHSAAPVDLAIQPTFRSVAILHPAPAGMFGSGRCPTLGYLMKPNILGDFEQAKYDAKREGNPAARFTEGQIENARKSAEENGSWEYLRRILRVCAAKKRALVALWAS